MNRSFVCSYVLFTSLWLAAAPTYADEPAQAQPKPDQHAAEARYFEDLDLLHSRLDLAEQIDLVVDFDAHDIALVHANGLGVDIAVPDAALKAQLNLPDDQGLTVTQVPDDSIGAQAGLKVHDVIVELDGQGVSEPAALARLLDAAAGKSVKIKLWRAGKQTDLMATPKKPEYARVRLGALFSDLDIDLASAEHFRIGVTLSEADDTLRQQLRLATGEGLVVTEVVADSAAAQAGLQVNDVLTMLDGKRLTTVEAINAQIQELKDKSVELRLLRGGKETTIQLAARKTEEAAFTDRPLVHWSTKSCRNCHVADVTRLPLGWRLGASHSTWTNGHHGKLWQYEYEKAYRAQTEAAAQQSAGATAPQQQIEALKTQLADMQKTLVNLEQSLRQPTEPAKKDSPETEAEQKKK